MAAMKLMAVAGAAVAIGIGATAAWLHIQHPADPSEQISSVEVGSVTARLADAPDEHYLRIEPILEVCCGEDESVKHRIDWVRDAIFEDLLHYSSRDLMKPEGMARLKESIRTQLNNRFHNSIRQIVFKDFLVE
jgi:flagellar basal body-associated protein FliL